VQVLLGIGQFLLVTAVAFVAIVLFSSFIRFQNLAHRTESDEAEDMDPHDLFQVRIAHRLGTAHRAPGPFCVIVLVPDHIEAVVAQHGESVGNEVLELLRERVHRAVRGTDEVVRYAGNRIGLIVNAPRAMSETIARRALDAVKRDSFRTAQGLTVRLTAGAGIATHPENGDRVAGLIAEAVSALERISSIGPCGCALAEASAGGETPPARRAEETPAAAPVQRGLVDPLTGVLKPARVPMALQKFVARFRKNGEPVSVLVLDVDHLDLYNEHYGRAAGDDILKGLGSLLQRSVREEDLVARLGGEEFVVAMGGAPRDAFAAGQRLVGLVKRTAFPAAGSDLRITISAGVAGYPDHGGNPRYLLEAADAALQAAKEKGCNLCLVYERVMHLSPPKARPTDVF